MHQWDEKFKRRFEKAYRLLPAYLVAERFGYKNPHTARSIAAELGIKKFHKAKTWSRAEKAKLLSGDLNIPGRSYKAILKMRSVLRYVKRNPSQSKAKSDSKLRDSEDWNALHRDPMFRSEGGS